MTALQTLSAGDSTESTLRNKAQLDSAVCSEASHDWITVATDVCRAAAAGDLEARILRIPEKGELSELLRSINHLLDMTDAFVREASVSLDYAGKGKFFRRVMLRGMLGSFRRAAECINRATEHMAGEAKALREAELRRSQLVDEFRASSTVVRSLETASGEIGNVVDVIRRITSQTSLLALNASIEAARVGELGRGFAVVANEVKSLSQQTANATTGIQKQIGAIQEAARNTVVSIERISETLADNTKATSS